VPLLRFDQFYYIATRHKETHWDFVNPLRKCGFINAIYTTDGADYVFYRDKDGVRHYIGKPSKYTKGMEEFIPWLVYRK